MFIIDFHNEKKGIYLDKNEKFQIVKSTIRSNIECLRNEISDIEKYLYDCEREKDEIKQFITNINSDITNLEKKILDLDLLFIRFFYRITLLTDNLFYYKMPIDSKFVKFIKDVLESSKNRIHDILRFLAQINNHELFLKTIFLKEIDETDKILLLLQSFYIDRLNALGNDIIHYLFLDGNETKKNALFMDYSGFINNESFKNISIRY